MLTKARFSVRPMGEKERRFNDGFPLGFWYPPRCRCRCVGAVLITVPQLRQASLAPRDPPAPGSARPAAPATARCPRMRRRPKSAACHHPMPRARSGESTTAPVRMKAAALWKTRSASGARSASTRRLRSAWCRAWLAGGQAVERHPDQSQRTVCRVAHRSVVSSTKRRHTERL